MMTKKTSLELYKLLDHQGMSKVCDRLKATYKHIYKEYVELKL